MNIKAIVGEPFRREIRENMPEAEYRAANGINPSALAEGIVNEFSPRYVRHSYETPSEPSDAMLKGQYGHCLLLEPSKLDETWAVWEGGMRSGEKWKAFQEEHDGQRIVRSKDMALVCDAVSHALERQEVVDLIGRGVAEVSVFTEEQGLQCKGRLDWVNTDAAQPLDVKFTTDIRPLKFGRVASNLAYTCKLAAYHRWFARESGKRLRPFQMLVIQLNENRPHDCCIVPVSEADLDYGWQRMQKMLGILKSAIERDEWPGVDGGASELPLWVPMSDVPYETDEVMIDE